MLCGFVRSGCKVLLAVPKLVSGRGFLLSECLKVFALCRPWFVGFLLSEALVALGGVLLVCPWLVALVGSPWLLWRVLHA